MALPGRVRFLSFALTVAMPETTRAVPICLPWRSTRTVPVGWPPAGELTQRRRANRLPALTFFGLWPSLWIRVAALAGVGLLSGVPVRVYGWTFTGPSSP